MSNPDESKSTEATREAKGENLIRLGIFLQFFPAIGGALFALFFWPSSWLQLIVFSYILWGWLSVILGIFLIVEGNHQKKRDSAKENPAEK